MFYSKINNKKRILYLLVTAIISFNARADEDFDLTFLNGNNTVKPDIFNKNVENVPGEYIADVIFNSTSYGRKKLIITKGEVKSLCLAKPWIESINLPINYEKISYALKKNNCYDFTMVESGKVDFDNSTQTLNIQLPQVAIVDVTDEDNWDYGTTGFRFDYSVNANKSKNAENVYGLFGFNGNYGRWVLSAKASGNINDGLVSPDLTLSTAIKQIRGDLIIGKTFTNTAMIPDFAFYGLTLRSNAAMTPWTDRGYAPVIDGILDSNALVTVMQGEYTLYSQRLPAGPFSLTNLAPISNGDMVVTIKEDNGISRSETYPVTVLPLLLREDDFNYNFAVGVKDNSKPNENVFGLASFDYGFGFGTLNSVSILHPHYQSLGFGASIPLGYYGGISANINYARSYYEDPTLQPKGKHTQKGLSASIQYSKDFGEDTNIQLLTYRYTDEGYSDFSSFNTHDNHITGDKRSRYEARITQRYESFYLNLSGWYQEYRNNVPHDLGFNATLSKTLGNGISIGLTSSYYKSGNNYDGYSSVINVTLPLDLWQKTQFINSSISYDSHAGSSFNSGMSVRVNDDINSSVSVNVGENNKTTSLHTGIRTDVMQTGFSISQSNDGNTYLSLNASGSIAAASDVGFAYSNSQPETIAIAHIDGLKDVSFNGSIPTNSSGNTIVSLSDYQDNNITIDTNNIPANVELLDSTYDVVPTNKAIIVKKYNYLIVNRYLLRVFDKFNNPYPMGTTVKSDNGIDVGVVANSGVLVATLLDKSKYLQIEDGDSTCKFDLSTIKPDNSSVIDLHCEL
ncbi:hypothetical protein C0W59_21575 [Photobacterium kishitanii]|uniref:fimbria/pilus outer membrane usher protein n=1 Tax=Photobacterium kishitanii TaxID=318456 RepID=UPI000D1762BE|nr:fimbria/pilus outer membrane usher protein [Photobacterium kishitanii]PSV10000.1 hypothetical protein C0W59_21575 [Photobacterium kishitanii]